MTEIISLQPFGTKSVTVKIHGITPLIVHRWSVKAREMILQKQTKKKIAKHELRDPEADYRESLYLDENNHPCFPAIALKACAVTACTSVGGVTKVAARQAFHINQEMLLIEGTPRMREDMVRIGMGTADLRYRAEFVWWEMDIPLVYNPQALSEFQLVNLYKVAGFAVGIGEHRPERDGNNGRFEVIEAK